MCVTTGMCTDLLLLSSVLPWHIITYTHDDSNLPPYKMSPIVYTLTTTYFNINDCAYHARHVAYPSGHLVPSPILGLANAPIVETEFLELAMSLLDFSPRIPLGTFSILLFHITHHHQQTDQCQDGYCNM